MLRKIEAKVLIVDDLPENLLALRSLIQSEDRTVFQASSADEALSLLLENEFALAILDVKMPGMNGFELAELMRGTEKTKHIPIIFVSAVGRDMDYAFRGYESGAVDFLHKPLSPFEVRSKVSMFVELYRHRKALSMQLEVVGRRAVNRRRYSRSCAKRRRSCRRRWRCVTCSCPSPRTSCARRSTA